MPLLDAETQIFPADLLDITAPLSAGEDWWVMYTLARQEKRLCRQLLARQIPFYCPTLEHRYCSPTGRNRVSHLPLFPNYVFVGGNELQRYQAVTTGCISQCLAVPDPDNLLFDLRQIKQLIDLGMPLSTEAELDVGLPVRVKSGPLQGFEGMILQRRNNRLLLVRVNFIQRGTTVELGDWEVEPLTESAFVSNKS